MSPPQDLLGSVGKRESDGGYIGPTFPYTYSVLRTNNKKPQETSGSFGLIGGDVASLCLGASIGKVDGNPGGKWLPS